MNKDEYGVHTTHCCAKHGCKYGDTDCPVVMGIVAGIEGESCEDCCRDKLFDARSSELEHKLAAIRNFVTTDAESKEQALERIKAILEGVR